MMSKRWVTLIWLWMIQDCDMYLLDDVLAAVDAHVAAQLWERAICGPLLACTKPSLLHGLQMILSRTPLGLYRDANTLALYSSGG